MQEKQANENRMKELEKALVLSGITNAQVLPTATRFPVRNDASILTAPMGMKMYYQMIKQVMPVINAFSSDLSEVAIPGSEMEFRGCMRKRMISLMTTWSSCSGLTFLTLFPESLNSRSMNPKSMRVQFRIARSANRKTILILWRQFPLV